MEADSAGRRWATEALPNGESRSPIRVAVEKAREPTHKTEEPSFVPALPLSSRRKQVTPPGRSSQQPDSDEDAVTEVQNLSPAKLHEHLNELRRASYELQIVLDVVEHLERPQHQKRTKPSDHPQYGKHQAYARKNQIEDADVKLVAQRELSDIADQIEEVQVLLGDRPPPAKGSVGHAFSGSKLAREIETSSREARLKSKSDSKAGRPAQDRGPTPAIEYAKVRRNPVSQPKPTAEASHSEASPAKLKAELKELRAQISEMRARHSALNKEIAELLEAKRRREDVGDMLEATANTKMAVVGDLRDALARENQLEKALRPEISPSVAAPVQHQVSSTVGAAMQGPSGTVVPHAKPETDRRGLMPSTLSSQIEHLESQFTGLDNQIKNLRAPHAMGEDVEAELQHLIGLRFGVQTRLVEAKRLKAESAQSTAVK